MAKKLVLQGNIAINVINFNNLLEDEFINLNPKNNTEIDITTKLNNYFSLNLSNSSCRILINGTFLFDIQQCLVAQDSTLSVSISVCRDYERMHQVYYTSCTISELKAMEYSNAWSLPITFVDTPFIQKGKKDINYYISVIINQNAGVSSELLTLKQYTLVAREI